MDTQTRLWCIALTFITGMACGLMSNVDGNPDWAWLFWKALMFANGFILSRLVVPLFVKRGM